MTINNQIRDEKLQYDIKKQIKTIEDQGQKQVEALKDLKPEEQTKAIEAKSNNKSMASNIFNDLIDKRKSIMNYLYESVDKNQLYFEYVGPTKDVRFHKYYDSKELFNEIKNNRLRFNDALKKTERVAKKNKRSKNR